MLFENFIPRHSEYNSAGQERNIHWDVLQQGKLPTNAM